MPHKNLDKWFYQLWQQYQDADVAYKSYQNEMDHKYGDLIGAGSDKSWAHLRKLKQDRKKASECVLGHAGSFEYVRCWMVDAVGEIESEPVQPEEKDQLDEYSRRWGVRACGVCKVMSKFNLTDSGSEGSRWHLGCHCTESEAYQLCRALTNEFGGALTKGFLSIERKPWSIELVAEDM